MKKIKIFALIAAVAMVLSLLAACGTGGGATPSPSGSPSPEEKTQINIGMLKGPTGMGAAYLMEKNELGEASNDYSFTVSAAPTDLTGLLVSGELDMAALSTNLAANLYQKTEGGVKIVALNTLGVLYILENGEEIQSVSDLEGKTVYATGQAANPEYVLNHILRENGLEPGEDVTVEFRDSDEIATLMAAGEIGLCMLPVPNVTSVMMKNSDVRVAIDLTKEWNDMEAGGQLTMGCVVVRSEFLEENPDAVNKFIEEYVESINYVKENVDEAAPLVAKYEITGSADIAAAAIPDANLTAITGAEIRAAIEGYYEVLFSADPASIGGAMPGEDFYYEAG